MDEINATYFLGEALPISDYYVIYTDDNGNKYTYEAVALSSVQLQAESDGNLICDLGNSYDGIMKFGRIDVIVYDQKDNKLKLVTTSQDKIEFVSKKEAVNPNNPKPKKMKLGDTVYVIPNLKEPCFKVLNISDEAVGYIPVEDCKKRIKEEDEKS